MEKDFGQILKEGWIEKQSKFLKEWRKFIFQFYII